MNAIQRNFTMNVWTITTACSVNQSKRHKNLICHTVTSCDVSPLLIWEYLFFLGHGTLCHHVCLWAKFHCGLRFSEGFLKGFALLDPLLLPPLRCLINDIYHRLISFFNLIPLNNVKMFPLLSSFSLQMELSPFSKLFVHKHNTQFINPLHIRNNGWLIPR